jgi:hypothetical protein
MAVCVARQFARRQAPADRRIPPAYTAQLPRTPDELNAALKEQIGFLTTSGVDFDAGTSLRRNALLTLYTS